MFATFALQPNVFAASTGLLRGSSVLPGGHVASNVSSITGSVSSVRGDATGVYYSSFTPLDPALIPSSSRTMTVYLMEYDIAPNADDFVKTYKASFKGRYISNIWLHSLNNPGNIDSSGDPTAELYLNTFIDYVNDDVIQSSTPIYSYEITLR